MLIYILLLVSFAVSSLFLNINSKRQLQMTDGNSSSQLNRNNKKDVKLINGIICAVAAMVLIIIAACRGINVGYDTINYESYFSFKQQNPTSMVYEPLFEFFNWLVVYLKLPFNFLLLICSAFFIIALAVAIYKYSPNVAFSWFLFVALGFFGNTFNAIRQYLAAAVFIFSLRYILKGKFISYLLCCLIAFYFHSSAIVLIPIYFIKYFKLNKWTIAITLVGTFLVGIFMEQITKLLSMITNFSYYERYYVTKILWEPIKLYYVLYSFGMICVFLLFYLLRKKLQNLNDKQTKTLDLFMILFFFSVCIRMLGTFSHMFSLVNRFSVYFFISIIFIIPYFQFVFRKEISDLMLMLIAFLGFGYNIISAVIRKTNGIYPYEFAWSNSAFIFLVVSIIIVALAIMILQSYQYYKFLEEGDCETENTYYKVNFNNKRF